MPHEMVSLPNGREEQANAASHAVGLLLAFLALPVLAQQLQSTHLAQLPHLPHLALRELGVQIFGASMVLTYLVSATYHAAQPGAARRWLRRCDHAAIFLCIAGSYTPFGLLALQHGQGAAGQHPAALLAAVWAVALAGMALKLHGRLRQRVLSTGVYLVFGWLVAAVAQPTLALLPPGALRLLVAGGLAYTLGSVFFLLDRRLPYAHLVWHLFVITGSACHVAAVQRIL